jgi:hypothetical protein
MFKLRIETGSRRASRCRARRLHLTAYPSRQRRARPWRQALWAKVVVRCGHVFAQPGPKVASRTLHDREWRALLRPLVAAMETRGLSPSLVLDAVAALLDAVGEKDR